MPGSTHSMLHDALAAFFFRWRLAATVVVAFALLAALAIALVPARYTATATLMVVGADELATTGGINQPTPTTLAREAVLSSEAAILRSPATMREVLAKLGDAAAAGQRSPLARLLDRVPGLGQLQPAGADETVRSLVENLRVAPDKAGGTIELAFTSADRMAAARVLNALIAVYQARRTALYGRVRSPSLAAASQAAKEDLERLDAELASFQKESGVINFNTQMELLLRNRQDLARLLQVARTDELETARRVASLRAQVGSTPREVVQYSDTESDKRVQTLRDSLADLRKQRALLRQTYTDESEKVVAIQQQIRLLEDEAGRASAQSAPSGVRKGINEVHTALELALLKADSEASALRERTRELARQASASEAEFSALQDKRARYDELVRQKNVAEQQYLAVVRAYNERAANEEIAQPGARVIQPAEPPLRPARTHAAILFAAGFLCVATLLGLAVFGERLSTTFVTAGGLQRDTGIPVLAQVPRLPLLASQPLLAPPAAAAVH